MTAGKSAKKDGAAAGSPAAAGPGGGEGAEVAEERVEVVTYAAAIDVAKGSGMVCTRVPGSRPDRKRQTVWQGEGTNTAGGAAVEAPPPAAGRRAHRPVPRGARLRDRHAPAAHRHDQ